MHRKEVSIMRQEVKWFAERMELTLALHDEKKGSDGWKNESVEWLLDQLKKEVDELEQSIMSDLYHHSKRVSIMKECFDIANFAMMIADNVR